MMSRSEKLITFFLIGGFLEISAQHPPQGVQKTFAETLFDLDPNLPSEDFTIDAVPPRIITSSQQQSQLPLQEPAKPAAMVRSPSAPANAQSRTDKKQSEQPEKQHFTVTSAAPRAKPYRAVAGEFSRHAKTVPPVATIAGQPQTLIPRGLRPPVITRPPKAGIQNPLPGPRSPLPVTTQVAPKMSTFQFLSPLHQSQAGTTLPQNHQNASSLLRSVTATPNPLAAPSVALGGVTLGLTIPVQRRISPASLWFNETLPSIECSRDYQHVAAEFKRKFPTKTAKDVRDKRLAEVVQQRLTDCDRKSKSDHWSGLIKSLPKAKLSPSEEEECRNGLVQERIACVNLMSFTCQFIKREYAFRLVPARVIMQEARLAEDGAEKCAKVLRNLFVFLPSNETMNRKRALQFYQLCSMLNEFYILPEHYCPFYFDRVSCWNATPPDTIAHMPCVTWQFARPNLNGRVQLRCNSDGQWQKVTGRDLVSMYKICKLPQTNLTTELGRAFAQVGYITSTIALITAVSIFIYLRLISGCKVVTALWNYFILCSYFWICVEGLYLHNIIYFNVFNEPKVWPYAVFGWGAPMIICSCWSVFKSRNDHTNCWLSLDYPYILKVPLIFVTLLELACTSNIARQLYYKLKDSSSRERDKYKKLARSTIYLICGTGVNFFIFDTILAMLHIFASSQNIAHSVYVVINSFWGLVAAALYCFCSEEIRSDWQAKQESRHLHASFMRELRAHNCLHSRKKGAFWKYLKGKESSCSQCKLRGHQTAAANALMANSSNFGSGTTCSTMPNSAQSTICERKYAYPVKANQLNFWKEEGEETTEK